MAEPVGGAVLAEVPEPPARAWVTRRELSVAAVIVGVLAAAGALLGLLWQAISPQAQGFVFRPHVIVPFETETLVATDGRFVVLTGIVGAAAGTAMWLHRSSRGPVVALALALGGLLGAELTALVGHLAGGGSADGELGTALTLQLHVHARGLVAVEAALALLVYGVCALFAKRDDLGSAP